MRNELTVTFPALSQNESLARAIVASFLIPLDPTVQQLIELKTFVSEAVTNAIVHGYNSDESKWITLHFAYNEQAISLEVRDEGVGIVDVDLARQPLYSTRLEEERSGMGFTIMESFVDDLQVETSAYGTVIRGRKQLVGVVR